MRILIVENEPAAAERLARYCRELLGARLESIHWEREYEDAVDWLTAHPIDLLIIDLNLRGRDGMQLLQSSVAGSFHAIIVSASLDQALRAFQVGAIDFVPKPFTRERFAQALTRAGAVDGRAPFPAQRLAVKKEGRVRLIAVADILYVKGADNYTELVLRDGKRELHDKSLERLAMVLPLDFERIHKSYLVRLSVIRQLRATEGSQYAVELANGEKLPVGRTRAKYLRGKLERKL